VHRRTRQPSTADLRSRNRIAVAALIVAAVLGALAPSASTHAVDEQVFVPFRAAAFSSGRHTGYRYDAAGRVLSTIRVSFRTRRVFAVSRRATIGGRLQLLVAEGRLAGYWVRESTVVQLLPAARSTPMPTSSIAVPSAAPAAVALGAHVDQAPWNISRLDQFSSEVGRRPAIVMWYQDWADPAGMSFRTELVDSVRERGATPLITWEPWDYRGGIDQPAFALRNIANGQHDTHITSWARAAAEWGHRLYVRFAHEMNASYYPWSVGANGNTAADYVAAWRHVVQLFRDAGASNVRWVWSPNIAYAGTTPFDSVFPGDPYVDWVALDGYNGGSALPWGGWISFTTLFGPSYDALTTLSARPVMVAEVASVEAGGSKAAWIEDAFLHAIPERFPRVRAAVWFDANKEADWRVASSETSLAAFRRVLLDPRYAGALP
jgi:hypothetical protein